MSALDNAKLLAEWILVEVEELGRWIGKPGRMVAAVTDEAFAQMIRRALTQEKTES